MPEGKLFLVATPIGNLGDISVRAVETLKNSGLVLCEDTRRAKILFNAHGIHSPMLSYHSHNIMKRQQLALAKLASGMTVSLISDAGTPGISDPGEVLVKSAITNNIKVECVPGPTAFVYALVCSGLPTGSFTFLGFLQRKKSRMRRTLLEAAGAGRTIIFYESPYRIEKTLQICSEIFPGGTSCVIARELTKKYEEFIRGTVPEVLGIIRQKKAAGGRIKGELVVLLK